MPDLLLSTLTCIGRLATIRRRQLAAAARVSALSGAVRGCVTATSRPHALESCDLLGRTGRHTRPREVTHS